MNTTPSRRPYQGVVQILQFNWRSYVTGVGSVGLALLALPFLPSLGRTVLLLGTAPTLFWLASSLLVSHYVYDHSPLYDLNWVCSVLSRAPRRWINIHCGLDETSALLAVAFPAEWFDAAFSIFAAHELRHHDQRVRLFGEIARTLTPDGEFILMEHSRDWRNFLAFGPGFLHFFSQSAWRKAASDAGLTVLA